MSLCTCRPWPSGPEGRACQTAPAPVEMGLKMWGMICFVFLPRKKCVRKWVVIKTALRFGFCCSNSDLADVAREIALFRCDEGECCALFLAMRQEFMSFSHRNKSFKNKPKDNWLSPSPCFQLDRFDRSDGHSPHSDWGNRSSRPWHSQKKGGEEINKELTCDSF